MKLKIFYCLSWFFIFITFFFMCLGIYWMTWPYKVIEFHDAKFPMKNTKVHAGDVLTYTADYCKYMSIPATVTRHIVNGFDYTMPSTVTNRAAGCHKLNISFILPRETPPGKGYSAIMIYKYEVNPIRTIVIEHPTVQFDVLEATQSAELQ